MFEIVSSFRDFLDKGGDVLYAILLLSIWLWWLILERFWYYFREHDGEVAQALASWDERADQRSWLALTQRRGMISEVEVKMLRNLGLIPALIALLPMFGLLGTVTGMIQVFDVMAFMGSGNPRAMADGVSAATIPTMAGMVVALIAIPFASQLDRRYRREKQRLAETLKIADQEVTA
ncbi:MotA/TolQ/ExbB proton channel family protein [Mangrovimicrobium sediminis]|uniref:MotA/TolQ/ExbB proton channel family protein n=1 Tax=Mangrovimicrobium sediminis TaxID=2562682 RepID=A0A4Z0M5E4_9GAMM|nr:MotA/TolQ/ExbB proton channel family protein [Haliea sp. SAOS-164]TGD74598.1 MotA/TolQ/ExbB proton channel family protein [Haliea sp. SAOS-164]